MEIAWKLVLFLSTIISIEKQSTSDGKKIISNLLIEDYFADPSIVNEAGAFCS